MKVIGPGNINQRMGNTDSKHNTMKLSDITNIITGNTLETYDQLCSLQ